MIRLSDRDAELITRLLDEKNRSPTTTREINNRQMALKAIRRLSKRIKLKQQRTIKGMKLKAKFAPSKSSFGYVFKVETIDGRQPKYTQHIHTDDGKIWNTWYNEPEANIKDGVEIEIIDTNHSFTISSKTGVSIADKPLNLITLNN